MNEPPDGQVERERREDRSFLLFNHSSYSSAHGSALYHSCFIVWQYYPITEIVNFLGISRSILLTYSIRFVPSFPCLSFLLHLQSHAIPSCLLLPSSDSCDLLQKGGKWEKGWTNGNLCHTSQSLQSSLSLYGFFPAHYPTISPPLPLLQWHNNSIGASFVQLEEQEYSWDKKLAGREKSSWVEIIYGDTEKEEEEGRWWG